jgi:pyruvate/2-oxoglutarate dehydrogenase complex dihydrolipoamide acyltransferase (E2) component
MSSFGNVNVNVTHNLGVISLGDGNTIDLQSLPADQHERVQAAVSAAATGHAQTPDAAELKAAVATAPDADSRTERVGKWLLKMAPAAAGVAGSLLTPAAGKAAELLAAWVARQLGGEA